MAERPVTDAEFEVVSGPLPSPHLAAPPPPRRYNWPKIAWQLYVLGCVLFFVAVAALIYLGPKSHFDPKTALPVPPVERTTAS